MSDIKEPFLSDVYILIPCSQRKAVVFEENETNPESLQNSFLNLMKEHSTYECNSTIANQLNRRFIDHKKLAYMNDNYGLTNEFLDISLYLTSHSETGLHVLIIQILNNDKCPTQILDQMSSDNLKICLSDGETLENISDYLDVELGLKKSGTPKALIALSKLPSNEKLVYSLLAAETYDSVHVSYKIDSALIKDIASHDVSQYDFYESYISNSTILFVMNPFSEDMKERMNVEVTAIFVCELVLFQNAGINRTNQRIVKALKNNKKVSLKEIELLYREFGNTIDFWRSDNYKYCLAQNYADAIFKAFKTEQLLADYYRNQSHLEHLVELRGVQTSEKEGKLLNFIAILLAVVQILPIIANWEDNFGNLAGYLKGLVNYNTLFITTVFILIISIRKRIINRRNKGFFD